MKYVMFKKKFGTDMMQYVPVIFPNTMIHAEVAQSMLTGPLEGWSLHSAGEWTGLDACGNSTTLDLKADPQDTVRIIMNDYGGAFE